MGTCSSSLKSIFLDLYIKPVLLSIAFYQIIATGTFTAQQILLAAYLDELGYLENYSILSGLILSIFFVFWFFLGPLCGTLSDKHGRKSLLMSSNLISAISFTGFVLSPHPLTLFFMNALLGIGVSLRIGSIVAIWVQKTPKERIGESMAYINIIIGIGGIGATLAAFYLWASIKELSFMVFAVLLVISVLPVIFIKDDGEYSPFTLSETFNSIKNGIQNIINDNFFFSKSIIQISIHWIAFSVIISFGTFLIPILERIIEEIPDSIIIPPFNGIFLVIGVSLAILGGLITWGRISDSWGIKPVLIIGFLGTGALVIVLFLVFELNFVSLLIEGFAKNDLICWIITILILISLFAAISITSTPMSWIIHLVGKENVAKAMSLRMAFIGLGTIIGTAIGGFILVNSGFNGLLFVILLFVLLSSIILI